MDPRKASRAGRAWEWALSRYLTEKGIPCEPRRAGGRRDRGDLVGIPGWTVEAKATKALDLAQGLAEASKEQANAGAPFACVIHKRRNNAAGEAYVTMTLDTWIKLVATQEPPDA